MTSQRIRYVSAHGDTNLALVSMRVFTVGKTDYQIYLYPSDLMFSVKNAVTGESVSEGRSKSLIGLKVKAKKALAHLGYEFTDEKRTKKAAEGAA